MAGTVKPPEAPPRTAIVKRLVLLLVFAGLFGVVYFLRQPSPNSTGGPPEEEKAREEKALATYGFYLKESAKAAGIDFVHQAPTLDPQLTHIMPIIASMGAGVSVVDFDRDGWPDVYVVNSGEGSKNRLYRNKGDGTFEEVAERLGVADLNQPNTGVCMGAVWGDFDNDGYEDLLVYKWGEPLLFHNDRGQGFTRVANAGLPKWANLNSAVWLDYDGDGKLDLFLAGYWRDDINLWDIPDTKIMPESFEYANNGGRKYLLRNKGDGTFEDVTERVGIKSRRWTLAVAAGHLCGGRYPDLFLANDYGVSEVYANRGGKEYVEIGKNCDIGTHPKSGMCASFGDVRNRGRLAVYVSNITEPAQLVQGNNFWVPQDGTSGEGLKFQNLAGVLGVENGGWSWGAQFGDLNNDGRLDLYLTNGYVSADRDKNYWYDYSLIAGALKGIIIDAKNWPAMKGRSLSGYQRKCLWWNNGGQFRDVAPAVGVTDTYDGRAVALADLGNRGALDVLVANQKGPLLLYRNRVNPENGWVQFQLEGTRSNRSAIGARVRLSWKNEGDDQLHEQLQEVSGGCGYASQNMRRLHFGLGKRPHVEKAVIQWPSGREQTLDTLEAGIIHKIKEPSE